MPSNNQSHETTNEVRVIGKIVEFEAKPMTDRHGNAAIVVHGQVMVKDGVRVRFDRYVAKHKKDGTVRKDYQSFEQAASKIKTIQAVGEEAATVVELFGLLGTNDRVNAQGQLIEALDFRPNTIRLDVPAEKIQAEYIFEGFISRIEEDGEGLRVRVYGLDYWGELIPFTFYVPAELKDVFEEKYEKEDTATFYLDYKAVAARPVAESGGIGVQRTSGAPRCGYVLVGADPALSPGERGAIDPDEIREAGAKRKARLREIEERGYRGGASSATRGSSLTSTPQPAAAKTADDFDF